MKPPHVLIVVDEGQGVRREIFEACESMLSGGHSKMLVTLNPLFAGGAAYAVWTIATQSHVTNSSVLLILVSVVIFLIGLVSEQIASLRFEGPRS